MNNSGSTPWSNTDTSITCDSPTVSASTHHEGNMYNHSAATAGTILNTAAASTDASGSICPKGWRLPLGMNTNRVQSYYRLLNSFAYNNTVNNFKAATSDTSIGGTWYRDAWNDNNLGTARWTIMRSDPPAGFAEVRSGCYAFSTGVINNRGQNGYGWASTAGTSGYSYILIFGTDNVYPGTNIYGKGFGFQVRCVLR